MWSDNDDLDDEDMDAPESPPNCHGEVPADHDANTLPLAIGFLLLQAQFHLTDRVVNMVFRFIKVLFIVLGRVSAPCAAIGAKLPQTFYMAQKSFTGIQRGKGFVDILFVKSMLWYSMGL